MNYNTEELKIKYAVETYSGNAAGNLAKASEVFARALRYHKDGEVYKAKESLAEAIACVSIVKDMVLGLELIIDDAISKES